MSVNTRTPALTASDIRSFADATSRSLNDKNNKIRETIIANIFTCPVCFFEDSKYGLYWTAIRDKLENALYSCFPESNTPYSFTILQKGGMSCNYDFEISTQQSEDRIFVEFKHNATSVKKLPQILELYDQDLCGEKFKMTHYSYSEFYYDNCLEKYLNFDKSPDSIIEIPEKKVYLKYITDTKYKHPFFHYLYSHRDSHKILKHRLVEQSKRDYLSLYSPSFHFDGLESKLHTSQHNKVYLMWDKSNFHIENIDLRNIKIIGIKEHTLTHSCFDLIVDNCSYNLRVRLNWGNNNGIANPRWKFKLIHK